MMIMLKYIPRQTISYMQSFPAEWLMSFLIYLYYVIPESVAASPTPTVAFEIKQQ